MFVGNQQLRDHLTFRNYLRDHPGWRDAYGNLKQTLAKVYKFDREAYTEAKTEFVLARLRRAWELGY
ncbi:GrpB family protein [Bacillus fonticola]|uniref:GrpB family protein n=1 Tax=Bacillus fonticola TaxID=2728853 RepID=UPI00147478A5